MNPNSDLPTPLSGKARYIMLGGFLGAGKTTAVAALAQQLMAQSLRVGLITNDQGSELVDTAMLRARGFATEEIPGGCFCCRFNSLVDAARCLDAASKPDVFIAEPVGSCTDLVATVTYPLRRLYGGQFVIAPLSVLVDPVRAERVLGLAEGKTFSEKVQYIYRKQLEEADLIVITKSELWPADRLQALRARLGRNFRTRKRSRFPSAKTAASPSGLRSSKPASNARARPWRWTTTFTPKAKRFSAGSTRRCNSQARASSTRSCAHAACP